MVWMQSVKTWICGWRDTLLKLTLSENIDEAKRSLSKCWAKFIWAQGFIYVQENTFAWKKMQLVKQGRGKWEQSKVKEQGKVNKLKQ